MSPPLNAEQAAKVERHTRLVRRLAYQMAREIGVMSIDELESIGNEALVQSAMRYDPSNAASFSTFAYYRIRGAMIDAVRKRTPGRRRYQRALAQLEASQALLAQAAEDQRARAQAGQRQTLEQRVASAQELVRRASLVVGLSEAEHTAFDRLADDTTGLEQRVLNKDACTRLRAIVGQLDDAQRQLVQALYVEARPMADVARELGVSVATISRRHARLLDELAERIGKRR